MFASNQSRTGFRCGSREVALEQAPHARLEAAVARLVVALPQPREDAEDAGIALRGERPISALEHLAVAGRRNVAVDHCPLDRRRHVAPRVLEHRSEIIGRMPGKRVLEVEQAEMGDAVPALDEHDVLGMIVAQDRHRAKSVTRDRLQHFAPGRLIGVGVHLSPHRRAIPFREQLQFLEPLVEPMRPQSRHRRVAVQVHEHVGRELVKLALALRIAVERLAQARAAEIAEQQQPGVEIACQDLGSAKTAADQPFRHSNERPGILVRRRRVHQHRAPLARARRGNSAGTMHRRQAAGSRPRPSPKQQGNHAHGAAGSSGRPSSLP